MNKKLPSFANYKKLFFPLFLILLFLGNISFGQYTVSGTLKDTVNFEFTQYTSVSLIKASDSILKTFTRADENGNFSLTAPDTGTYLLLFEHPRFASYVDKIHLTKSLKMGTVPLISKKNLLQEVIISGKQAITVKGDTVEYTADSFKTGQFDDVDALLRQLPGIEVNSDGSIKAYGQTVQKMLVDGEEFFSDDPAMVAKMLRASSVDKVQVYDKKTDQAEFTGIDDGQRIKTINLKLKDNAKRGYFGKVSAGGGIKDFWQNQGMINAFKGKRKIAAYAIMSNTNQGGLGFQDSRNFAGGGGGMSISDDGGVSWSSASSGNSAYGNGGNFSGQGLPKTWNGGAYYSNSWWGDTLKFNGGYNFNKNEVTALSNTITHYILPDTQYFNTQDFNNENVNIAHNFNVNSQYKIDSLTSLNLRINGSIGTSHQSTTQHTQALTPEGVLVNDNQQMQTNDGNNQNMTGFLSLRKKFKKAGRSFAATLSGNLNDNNSNGILQSEYHLFAIDSTNNTNQKKKNKNDVRGGGLTLNYTEPLSEKFFLLFDYQINVNDQESQITSLNPIPGTSDNYEVVDSQFSNHYRYNSLTNRGGMQLRIKPAEKLTLNIGGDLATTNYVQKDLIGDSSTRYNYLNFFPNVSVYFRKNMQSNFSFNYNGSSQAPSMSQLQPVQNNDDPLNIAVGNPDLKQAFIHTLRAQYFNYKVLTSTFYYVGMYSTINQNAIAQSQNVDNFGRRLYQYVNTAANYNFSVYGNYGRKIIGNFSFNTGLSSTYGRTHNFINELANINNSWMVSPNLSLSFDKDTVINIDYIFSPSYNSSVSSIRSDIQTNYWNFSQNLNLSVRFPRQFRLGMAIDWEFRQQLSSSDTKNKVFLWNPYVAKSFLKDHSLEARFYVNDLLNQNVGYQRVTSAEQISETTYNTIKRYFMLTLTWNFTKMGKAPAAEAIPSAH